VKGREGAGGGGRKRGPGERAGGAMRRSPRRLGAGKCRCDRVVVFLKKNILESQCHKAQN